MVPRTKSQKQVALFSHLQQYERERSATINIRASIHPTVIQVGLRFAEGMILGSNARCVGTLQALKAVIHDYTTPPKQVLKRHLDSYLKPQISFLVQFRPMSISMGNAIRYLKMKIAKLEPDMPEADAKLYLCECIDTFINERIMLADQIISSAGAAKISSGDVLLTYAKSSIVQKTLLEAHRQGKQFRVIVIDSRPKYEGKQLLKVLLDAGIPCSYELLNAVPYMMREVSKVFLGAHGFFSNGTLLSRVGTAVVAMEARAQNVPVMVCCETYKFSERVQLDSFVFNELGDPDELIMTEISSWRDIPSLKLLNLMYDVTPAEYISMVITEIGMIPCTSVPVVLREYHACWNT